MQNSMIPFTFFIFDQKCRFWANLVQNIKIVSLRLNLLANPIQICRIQWCCSLFSLSIRIGPKCQNYQFKLKSGSEASSNMQSSMVMFTFFSFQLERPFLCNLVQNVKTISLSCNLVASLIRICRIQWWCSLFSFLVQNTLF